MYVFAGMHFTNDRGRFAQFNNVYRLNLKTMLWSEVITSGDVPGPRDKHTAVVWEHGDNDPLMIVFGGRDPTNYLNNQTYVLNLVNHTWRHQTTTTATGTYQARVFRTHKCRHCPRAERRVVSSHGKRLPTPTRRFSFGIPRLLPRSSPYARKPSFSSAFHAHSRSEARGSHV
jgi:hypothetical protein